jgi:hypothetical protein
METICQGCQENFECSIRKYNSNMKKGFKIYCSSKCYNERKSRENSILTECFNCGISIKKSNAQVKKSLTGNLYCSKSCATSKNNSLFKKWENSPKFRTGIRNYRERKLMSIDHPMCEVCKIDDIEVLEIHHKDKNRKNNKLENLRILCCNCHTKEHRKNIEMWGSQDIPASFGS